MPEIPAESNDGYQQINITPPNSASVYFRSGDTIYYMPMKEF